jgi:hypothetical protein
LLLGARSLRSVMAGMAYLLLLLLVLTPADIFINSAFYHLIIGRLFRIYNRKYQSVFTAATYGALPALLVYWLYPVGFVGVLTVTVFSFWGFFVEIISFSNQLGMSRLKAFGTFILYLAIMAALVFVFGALFTMASIKA